MTYRKNQSLLSIKSGTPDIAWPPITMSARASLVSLLYQMDEIQWLPQNEITEGQFHQVKKLAEHAFKYSPFFHQRMLAAGLAPGDLATPEGFRRLPLLTRRDIQSAGGSLFCTEVSKDHLPLWELTTSGSTGEKVLIRKTSLTSMFWIAMTLRGHFWHQRDFSKRLMAVRDAFTEPKDSPDWGHPINLLFDSGPLRIIPGKTPIDEYERHIREFQPHYLIVYPSVLAAIMEECKKKNSPALGIEQIITIGEHLKPELRRHAEEYLKARVYDIYSSSEMGNTAIQCPESGFYHVMAENILMEVLDTKGQECAEGEIGRVVVTDLSNFTMPLIRYAIGDYAEMGGKCPCGRGLPVIRRFIGRERNLALHPNGTRYWPVIGSVKFHEVAPIHQAQFIQHDPETLEVRLATEASITPAQEQKFSEMIHQVLGYPYKVSFVYFPERLPLPPNGKFEDFICKVA